MTETNKTYILELKGGNLRKITIPSDWKITFGPLIPGERSGPGTLALRIYEGKDRQRALFTDVKSFRDVDIPLLEKVTKTKRQAMNKNTPEGMRHVVVEAKVSSWRNADEPDDAPVPDEYLAIETKDEDGDTPAENLTW